MGIRFLGTQETIIYRIVMRNHYLDAFLKKLNFWREIGRGRLAGAKGSRALRPQKVGPLSGTFGSTVISGKSFRKFKAWKCRSFINFNSANLVLTFVKEFTDMKI